MNEVLEVVEEGLRGRNLLSLISPVGQTKKIIFPLLSSALYTTRSSQYSYLVLAGFLTGQTSSKRSLHRMILSNITKSHRDRIRTPRAFFLREFLCCLDGNVQIQVFSYHHIADVTFFVGVFSKESWMGTPSFN